MTVQWKGILPALTTKFTKNDKLDLPLFKKNLEAQVEGGVNGIILGGTLGESSVLSIEEKEQLVRFSVETLENKIPVILNIAAGSTKEAMMQSANAKKWGASGLMVLPPMRYKSDHRETVTWFKTIAENTDLPIMVYNNPVDYKTEISLDIFEEILQCNNIQAVKESTRDVTNVTRMINRFGKRLNILCGVDTLALEELILGAVGWVAGLVCAFPKETVAIYNFMQEGRVEEAIKIYRWFMPLLELDIHPKLVQYIKLAESRTGLGSEFVRAPRLVLEGEEREVILGIIDEGIKTRPV
ncbi:MAG: dihydrodipicolinate synthase family protein [Ferruginibacter sp.]